MYSGAFIQRGKLYDEEKYLEAELIKQEELYGIRFTDAVQQFITLKK